MVTLDCESFESALDSLAKIYGLSTDALTTFLSEFDLEAHYKKTKPRHDYDTELRIALESSIARKPQDIERTYWFHLTRSLPDSNFSSGILPLSQSLDGVWDTFQQVFRRTEHAESLIELRAKGVPNEHYNLKSNDPLHAGPYAMLVREIAFYPDENCTHDYLRIPEIMEDICDGYREVFGREIQAALEQALVPKIVKFWSAGCREPETIEVALQVERGGAYLAALAFGRICQGSDIILN